MSVAILGYKKNGSDDVFTLENSRLETIDAITKSYTNDNDLILSHKYSPLIRQYCQDDEILNGRIVLNYIKNNNDKINLPILYDDPNAIITRASSLDENKSEVEISRKLLLNSKNKIFLKLFMNSKTLRSTTSPTVKMTFNEYKIAKKENLHVFNKDGEYHIPISDVFQYRLNHNKLGPMRLLVEDTLEIWRNNILNFSNEDLYFCSRELRLLINEYNYRKIPRKIICDLSINYKKFHVLIRDNFKLNQENSFGNTKGLSKRKVLL